MLFTTLFRKYSSAFLYLGVNHECILVSKLWKVFKKKESGYVHQLIIIISDI